jgi:hypothetical protein
VAQSPPLPPSLPDGDRAITPPLPITSPLGPPETADTQGAGELPAPPKVPAPPPLPPENASQFSPTSAPSWWSDEGAARSSAWLVSFVVHAIVLFLLGLITLSAHSSRESLGLLAWTGDGDSAAADPGPGDIDQQAAIVAPVGPVFNSPKDAAITAEPVNLPADSPKIILPVDGPSKIHIDRPAAAGAGAGDGAGVGNGTGDGGAGPPRLGGRGKPSQIPNGGGWEGRTADARAKLAASGGGSRQSEAAVERGLLWLVAHQREDGSWCFDLEKTSCKGMCRNSGSEPSTTAATGLALLPFLGAGYTHTRGQHHDVVKKGVYYLKTRARLTPHGIDLCDGGNMYAHGIATLALCEAYGMTHDESLKEIAQGAIRFIVYAQDLHGGGWRYMPGMPGDTTVTGWQLMSLKSGQMAHLEVPSPTINRAERFLNSVQFDKGSRYGYMTPRARAPRQEATTAVGLLLRMYTGWHSDRPAIYRGVAHLHRWGPSETNMYYDFYATQVLHHWERSEWQTWNKKMRDYLVATQAAESHENGSWYFPDPLGDRGGRLYNTAMALMILEVYYRHMPLYGQQAVRD